MPDSHMSYLLLYLYEESFAGFVFFLSYFMTRANHPTWLNLFRAYPGFLDPESQACDLRLSRLAVELDCLDDGEAEGAFFAGLEGHQVDSLFW